MQFLVSAVFLFVWSFLPTGGASDLFLLTSSLFQMELAPTKVALTASAANKLELSIRTALFQSSSVASEFVDVFDIHIVMRTLEWIQDTESTMLQFQAHVTFYGDDERESTATPPTQFYLDSLIARTFSQPSTKSGFLVQLNLTQDPSLSLIQEVSMVLVPSNDTVDDSSSPENSKPKRQLSTLDIILIVTSAATVLVILCVIYAQHRGREQYTYADFLALESSSKVPTPNIAVEGIDSEEGPHQASSKHQDSTANNVDVTVSMDSDGQLSYEEPAQPEATRTEPELVEPNKTPKWNDTVITPEKPTPESTTTRDSHHDDDVTPPVSPSPSLASSSSEVSPTTQGSHSLLPSPMPSVHSSSFVLGVSKSHHGRDLSPRLSPLTARLLRLPSMTTEPFPMSGRSYSSAPANLLDRRTLTATSEESSQDGTKSVQSASKSVRSAWSSSSLFDVAEHPGLETASTRSSTRTDLAVISDFPALTTTASDDFEKNWKISEKMAEEDADDDSTMDVFHVDIGPANNSNIDEQSRMSGRSAVSDWLKSIRVVGGSADSRTSEMSKSSAEHSSVEPRLMQVKDNISVDVSLERSLASSVVEV